MTGYAMSYDDKQPEYVVFQPNGEVQEVGLLNADTEYSELAQYLSEGKHISVVEHSVAMAAIWTDGGSRSAQSIVRELEAINTDMPLDLLRARIIALKERASQILA